MCSWWREQQSPKRDSQVLKCYDNVSSSCYRNDAIHSLLHTEISMTYCFRFFVGVFGSWRYLLRNLQRTVPWGTSMTERSMRKCAHVLLLPFSLVFPLNLSESILKEKAKSKTFVDVCQQRIWPQVSFCVWWIDSLVPAAKGSRWKKSQWQFCSSCMLQQNTKYCKGIFSSYNFIYQMKVSGRQKCPF